MATLEPKKGSIGLLIITVLASFTLTWVLVRVKATGNTEQTSAIQMPGTTTGHVVVHGESFLPEGTVMVSESRGDVDQDGMAEIVIAFNGENQSPARGAGGLLVLDADNDHDVGAWQTRPPSKGRVTDLVLEDIDQDGGLEILLYKAAQDDVWYYLHIYRWDGSEYDSVTPRGGPLDGMEAFASDYYPPEVRNVDSSALDEIVVLEDDGSSARLKAIVYRWDGENYTHADWIVMLGPSLPRRDREH